MLSPRKQEKLLDSVKKYSKQYLQGKFNELDESGTRLMVNSFLTEVLSYLPIEEVKTEYMIRGTYADYVIQTGGNRHFLVEVKALSLSLSDKHLRQAVNYGANEGIEWVMLTNGRVYNFYKVLFNKPIESRLVFSFDLGEQDQIKSSIEFFQYLHKETIEKNSLDNLWNKFLALDPLNIAGYLYAPPVMNFIKKVLKEKYKHRFSDDEVKEALNNLVTSSLKTEDVNIYQDKKVRTRTRKKKETVIEMKGVEIAKSPELKTNGSIVISEN